MSWLFVDTETTGVNPRSARMVQLAGLLVESRPPYAQIASFNEIIKPHGFTIPAEAAAIHGISQERALATGIHLDIALERFLTLFWDDQFSPPTQIIAHNLDYDNTVFLSECRREGVNYDDFLVPRPFCTMKAMTDRCRIEWPVTNPRRIRTTQQYKWPRLNEAYIYCFNQLPDEEERGHAAHSAMGDCLSVRDIYLHGIAQGWWQ